MSQGLFRDDDGELRCWWCAGDLQYQRYHDTEWGFPVRDDTRLFEKLCLEGFQSGLSWLTILRKRENFRKAFAGFDVSAVARFTGRDVRRLLKDAGIVRHRGKIESTINNARRAVELIEEHGSIAAWVWKFEPPPPPAGRKLHRAALFQMTRSPESIAMSKDLKKRGWSFVGPTTVISFMQAMGLVNHHVNGCRVREQAEAARKRFRRPASNVD